MFFFNPFWPLTALRIASLKATSTLLLLLFDVEKIFQEANESFYYQRN